MARRRDWVNNRIRLSAQSRGDPWLGGGQVADPRAADVARSRCGMGRYGMVCVAGYGLMVKARPVSGVEVCHGKLVADRHVVIGQRCAFNLYYPVLGATPFRDGP
jgi:hypothetical protein